MLSRDFSDWEILKAFQESLSRSSTVPPNEADQFSGMLDLRGDVFDIDWMQVCL